MKTKKQVITVLVVLSLVAAIFSVSALISDAADPTPSMEINYCNLSFRDTVYIKYAVLAENASGAKLLIWNEPQDAYTVGTEDAVLTSEYSETISGKSHMIFDYSALYARQMADVVYARAYVEADGVAYYSDVNKYSIMQYVYNKLGKTGKPSSDEDFKAMLSNMLIYGASAQKYFDYRTDRLASDDFYQVKLAGGVFDDGADHGLYLPGEVLTATAPVQDATGGEFAYWQNTSGERVAFTPELTVTVGEVNETYTAVYLPVGAARYTVTFVDHDGALLSTVENVFKGDSVNAPAAPLRAGYTFTGWDTAFDNVQSDLTVTAQYSLAHNQIFFDYAENGDTVTVTASLKGEVKLFGLECKLSLALEGMSCTAVESAVSGLAINDKGSYIIVSFVDPSGDNATEEMTLFTLTLTKSASPAACEITVYDVDIFDDSFVNEDYSVAGTVYTEQ